jgi:hypothetical protein
MQGQIETPMPRDHVVTLITVGCAIGALKNVVVIVPNETMARDFVHNGGIFTAADAYGMKQPKLLAQRFEIAFLDTIGAKGGIIRFLRPGQADNLRGVSPDLVVYYCCAGITFQDMRRFADVIGQSRTPLIVSCDDSEARRRYEEERAGG